MALVHLNDGRLPEDRVSLYSRCIDILLGQWEVAGKDETVYGSLMDYIGLPDTNVKVLRPLLSKAAFVAHEAGTTDDLGRIGRATLREMVQDELAALKHPNPYDGAKLFLEYTDVRAGLLQASDAGDAYAFPHQTFQEYLAGLELVGGVEPVPKIMDKRIDDRWRVPIFLGVGHTISEGIFDNSYRLLNRLLQTKNSDEPRRQRDVILAAELAADVTWERLERGGEEFSALKRELAHHLVQVVEGKALPAAERVHAGVLLGDIGDLRLGVCTLPPAMVPIKAGSIVVGHTFEETNHAPIEVRAFEIDRYPVTNAQYAIFINQDGYNPKHPWWDNAGRDWLVRNKREAPSNWWDNERFGVVRPNHPVVGVTWYEARAFCAWLTLYLNDGWEYRLPTRAEWDYAAYSSSHRRYPWGTKEVDIELANYNSIHENTTAVGCFPQGATPEGILDLVGNVSEWTDSMYRETFKDEGITVCGGNLLTKEYFLEYLLRQIDYRSKDFFNGDLGFRLARHLP